MDTKKDMCYDEIQNEDIVLGSIINTIGRSTFCDYFKDI